MLKIIPFDKTHSRAFKELNIAWLEKYFYVEPKDEFLLGNGQANIIDKGGHIFMAIDDAKIVGCFALLKNGNTCYELGKMAVADDAQGKQIGQKMLIYAIDFAKIQNMEAIELYSSTKLPAALHIYKKYGFVQIELEKDLPYKRSDIKMKLKLK
ncbi:GNAT family N-acetyltransferase [Maribacter sp. 2210JD10-5]|uniref:GNAT family N-acetyltransferase n=1 Tax=Maribacter sp. 2210JD10-5 TaxID=3386272 RepID=UPI0039BD8C87